MPKILVLYHSLFGHVETLAYAAAEGAREVPGAEVVVKRVPEHMPEDVLLGIGAKPHQKAAIANPEELSEYDAIILGTGTRFGNMSGQMRNFFDQTGRLWSEGGLIGKVGSVFISTGTGGGNETTITSVWNTLAHHGMVIVGLPYSAPDMMELSEIRGGSPYGASTFAGADGLRQPSETELSMMRFQARHVTQIAAKLSAN